MINKNTKAGVFPAFVAFHDIDTIIYMKLLERGLFMETILIVGGTFDNNGGKPSSLVNKVVEEMSLDDVKVEVKNGGYYDELILILNSTINYKYVIWWANVPNDLPKIRNVKEINPKCILVTSKRNDNNQYGFAELINRALSAKANLCVEFSKWNDIFAMRVFDPLGNSWYHGYSILDMSRILVKRMQFLAGITRQGCLSATGDVKIPEETDFFEIVKHYADIFHELIQPEKGVTRFLGNSSFRCQRGFPSFRKGDKIFVSRRNIDKRYIDKDGFVPVKMDDSVLWYYGENKPCFLSLYVLKKHIKIPQGLILVG